MVEYKTIEDIRAAHEAEGLYFFAPSTMRYWKSRVSSRIYPVSTGAYFVTSETDFHGDDRRYTIRFADSSARITDVGEFRQYKSASGAHKAAKRFADKANLANRDYGTIWVCVCCMLSHANGECCADDTHGGDGIEPMAIIGHGFHVSMGLGWDEHECDNPGEEECDCDRDHYSKSQCEGCGSYLHGERYAFHLWKD